MTNINEFIAKTDEDLIWRKRELTNLKNAIERGNSVEQKSLTRAAVALLYAHWEGYVKKNGTSYLEHVIQQRHNACDLKSSFIAIRFKNDLAEAYKSKTSKQFHNIIDFFRTGINSRIRINTKSAIKTKGNLSSNKLKEILSIISINDNPFVQYFPHIDKAILERRNYIAHGESLDITPEEYSELHIKTIEVLECFKTNIQNAAINKKYLI